MSNKLPSRSTYPLIVFLTGAAVLIIEILATRVLAPFFGNTIFTVSSVIGVILAALSFGYMVGGHLADRRPSARLFYLLIAISGLLVIFLQFFATTLLPAAASRFSLVWGPPLVSLWLFFLPGLVLGMLSPFAIKLQHLNFPEIGLGKLAGEIFFWSTLGSIFGTFLAGFYLIPRYGITTINLSVGLFLTGLGLVGFVQQGPLLRGQRTSILIILFSSLALTLALTNADPPSGYIYQDDGIYQKIGVFNTVYQGRPARAMLLDSNLTGALFLDDFQAASDYINYYRIHRLTTPKPARALVIGGGAYLVPKFMLEELDAGEVHVAEIEPDLLPISRQYFALPKNPRLINHVTDARRLLNESTETFDLIFSDAYLSLYSVPTHLTTREFFQQSRDKLADDGIFIANFIGALEQSSTSSFFGSAVKTFQSVFPNSYIFAVRDASASDTQNFIFVGLPGDNQLPLDSETLSRYQLHPLPELDRRLVDLNRLDLSREIIFTDDYAPTDYLIAKLLTSIK